MARRGPNEGSIISVGPNRWRLRKDHYAADGTRKWIDETVRGTKKQAEGRMEEIKAMSKAGIIPTGGSLDEYLHEWLDAIRPTVKPKTHYDYTNTLKYATARYGRLRLQDLRGDHLQKLYADMLGKGLSTRTVRLLHVVLGSAFKAAVKWGRLAYAPTDRAIAPKQQRREIKAWCVEEVRQFSALTNNHPHSNLYQFLIYTGLRRAEVCGLKWSDVDIDDNRVLTVRRILHRVVGVGLVEGSPKTRRSMRQIVLCSSAAIALKKERAAQLGCRLSAGPAWIDGEWVFTNRFGAPIDADRLTTEFKNIIKDTSLTQITLNGLRHTFTSLSILAKVEAKVISDSLGHSSVSFTLDTYGHLFPVQKQEAADALDQLLKLG